jgi:hypothetical protein
MERFGTLESPFDPDYLQAVLEEAGFTQITRFAAVDELLDVSDEQAELERVRGRLRFPPMNTFIAVRPVSVDGEAFSARIEAIGAWESSQDGHELALPISVTNTGRSIWPAATGTPMAHGAVTIGAYVLTDDARIELPVVALSRSLMSGESAGVHLRVPTASVVNGRKVEIDLKREGIAWFAEHGSEPLLVPLPDES